MSLNMASKIALGRGTWLGDGQVGGFDRVELRCGEFESTVNDDRAWQIHVRTHTRARMEAN